MFRVASPVALVVAVLVMSGNVAAQTSSSVLRGATSEQLLCLLGGLPSGVQSVKDEQDWYYDHTVPCQLSTVKFVFRGGKVESWTPTDLTEQELVSRIKASVTRRGQPQRCGSSAAPISAPASSQSDQVQQEIDRIRSGRYSPMPTPQASGASGLDGQTSWVIQNGTSYSLTVFLSGPVRHRMDIPAGGSQTLRVSPGNYEVAASVSGPNVIPFYGTINLGANTQYTEQFYIK
jgi:hypothetical protein